MTIPLIAALTAGVLIMLQTALMLNVGLYRGAKTIGIGDGDDPDLLRRIRRHGNLAENAALIVVGIALAEISGASTTFVLSVAAIFVVGRLFHAMSFASLAGSHLIEGSKLFPAMRMVGAMSTAGVGFMLGGYLVYATVTGGVLGAG